MSRRALTLVLALIPAVIAGLFAVAPKIYEEISEPAVKLVYSLTVGPSIDIGDEYRRIYSISVINSGDKALHNVEGYLRTSGSNTMIEALDVTDVSGVRPKITTRDNEINFRADLMHPKETIKLAIMLRQVELASEPILTVRSDEVRGRPEDSEEDKAESQSTERMIILGALLSAVSVFFMTAFTLTYVVRSRAGLLPHIFRSVANTDRQDILIYIAGRAGLHLVTQLLLDSEMTYRRAADLILFEGQNGTQEQKRKAAAALKSMLLIDNIAQASVEIITKNIEILDDDHIPESINMIREKALSLRLLNELRARIDRLIADEYSFLLVDEDTPIGR